ncbi:MAG: hypothetical protein WDZ40_02155 [Candidatus Spechtbacterales bacterium]
MADFFPALVVLGIVIGIYIGTSIWFNGLISEYDSLQAQKTSLENEIKRAQTPEFGSLVSRARALENVISNHVVSSKVFRPVEGSIHSQIFITSMELSVSDSVLSVSGNAPDFESLGEQFVIWKDESIMFKDVQLTSFSRDEDGIVVFSVDFDIKEDYLK